MRDGFIKVASVTPKVKVADVTYNVNEIAKHMAEAVKLGAKIVVFPELAITGYTCGDLFYQETLLKRAKKGLLALAKMSADKDAIFFVGLPILDQGKLYNVAAVLHQGEVLGLIPKTHLPVHAGFDEARHFAMGMEEAVEVMLAPDCFVPMGTKQLFQLQEMPDLVIAVEVGNDLWAPCPPSIAHCLNGATLVVNLSAGSELTGQSAYRRDLVVGQSARLYCGYIYTSAGDGESTQDIVCSGHNIIAEAGDLLEESALFTTGCIMTELDVKRLLARRQTMSTFNIQREESYLVTSFSLAMTETKVTRFVDKAPFVPADVLTLQKRCEEILEIQSVGLKKRLAHTNCQKAVVGISGGLDSTLALLVTVKAFDMLSLDRKGIIAVTMPGFGTTDRTYNNAVSMIKELGVTFREVSIKEAVTVHFADIGQSADVHDVTYENSQARERTQILMDIANMENGMVIGTGDMSELALGWATYNGDHMSMYGVNASVPKTLVRHLVQYYAKHCCDGTLSEVLFDVLDTPVSPELLPPEDGKISQKTEELVGPYELHDFYLYYLMRYGCEPTKIYRLAKIAFAGEYDSATILKWLKTFYRRFFTQQFKRSCLPDGPKVGTVGLSPRGDLHMPSDAAESIWMEELERLEENIYEKNE